MTSITRNNHSHQSSNHEIDGDNTTKSNHRIIGSSNDEKNRTEGTHYKMEK